MAKAKMKIHLSASAEQVWKVITDNKNYNWRSDLSRIEEMGDGKTFVEYTKNGYPTTFTITRKVPFSRYEFDMENENMRGHWTGLLRESGNGTEIDFTEEVEMKKPFMKFAANMYLKKQQKKYAEDLKKELGV